MSRLVSGPKLSRMRVSTSGTATQPDRDVDPEDPLPGRVPATTAPPTSGPLATARPVIALKIPIAAPRRSGGKAALSSARPSGTSSAAPAPCSGARGDQQPTLGASAQAADAAAKSARPMA